MTNKHPKCEAGRGGITVVVRNDDIDKALKVLKKKVLTDGLLKEIKMRKAYEKPSEKKRRVNAESRRREQKMQALRIKHEGF